MPGPRSGGKALAVLRRWALPVVALSLIAGYGGSLLSQAVSPSYAADAVLIVPPNVTPDSPEEDASSGSLGSPGEASRLAQTYAAAIPASSPLREAVTAGSRVPVEVVANGLTAVADRSTSAITLTYEGSTEQEVLAVLQAAVAALTGDAPPAPIAPGTLQSLGLPDAAESTGPVAGGAVSTGIVAGLLLGLFLAWAVERSDACTDTVGDLRAVLPCPVTDWRRPSVPLGGMLVEHWTEPYAPDPVQLALIGVGRLTTAQLGGVSGVFDDAAQGTGRLARVVQASSSRGLGEYHDAVARSSDVTVLVVRSGTRVADVRHLRSYLAQLGVEPDWALLTARKVDAPAARTTSEALPSPEDDRLAASAPEGAPQRPGHHVP